MIWRSLAQKQDGRLSPAYFPPSNLLKMPFKRMKTYFFEKILFMKFNFFKIKNYLILLQKNIAIKVEKTFLRNSIIWYAFNSKFATFNDFEEKSCFFWKPIYFFKKKHFEKSYYFSHILWQICYNLVIKSFQFQNLGIARTIWVDDCPSILHMGGY